MKKIRKTTRTILFAIVILVVVVTSFSFVACRDWAYLCENTGSRKGHREWFFGLKSGHWYQTSAVETFMQERFPTELQHRWTSYAGTGKNIFGVRILYGHGMPGPIASLPPDVLNQWFAPLPESEKKGFYDVLVSGDREIIKQKVTEILEQAASRP